MLFDSLEICRGNYNSLRVMTASNPHSVETLGSCFLSPFAAEMLTVREGVVNLLMWEIGKGLEDSSKEFDRPLQYIHKTVEALKEVDRTNSRFSLDGGVIVQVRRSPRSLPFDEAVRPDAAGEVDFLEHCLIGNCVLIGSSNYFTAEPKLREFLPRSFFFNGYYRPEERVA
jgi:hypothetical protein